MQVLSNTVTASEVSINNVRPKNSYNQANVMQFNLQEVPTSGNTSWLYGIEISNVSTLKERDRMFSRTLVIEHVYARVMPRHRPRRAFNAYPHEQDYEVAWLCVAVPDFITRRANRSSGRSITGGLETMEWRQRVLG